jgi:hypothetical protein
MIGILITGLWGFFVSDYYECLYNKVDYIEKDKIMKYTTNSDMRKNVLIFFVLKRSSIDDEGLLLNVVTLLEYEDNDLKITLERNSSTNCSPNKEFCEPV